MTGEETFWFGIVAIVVIVSIAVGVSLLNDHMREQTRSRDT